MAHPHNRSILYTRHWNSAYVNQSSFCRSLMDPRSTAGRQLDTYCWLFSCCFARMVLPAYFAGIGLAYGLYLTNIEAHILQVWCVYRIASLILIVASKQSSLLRP